MSKDNLKLWDALATTDPEYTKKIGAGRLKGMTDINPMWRWKRLSEEFGPCGKGWSYVVKEHGVHHAANDEAVVWVLVELYAGEGALPIPAFGASKLAAHEKKGLYVSDEAWKMALTDALGKAASMLGLCADVYLGAFDGSKYSPPPKADSPAVSEAEADSLLGSGGGESPSESAPAEAEVTAPPDAGDEYQAGFDKLTWSEESWGLTPHCPYCEDFIYDNREPERGGTGKYPKRSPKAPDFKHKKGAECDYVLWPSGEWARG